MSAIVISREADVREEEGKCLRFCVGKYYVVLRMTYSIVVAWRHSSSCFIDSYQPAAIHGHDVNYKYVYYAPRRIPSSSYIRQRRRDRLNRIPPVCPIFDIPSPAKTIWHVSGRTCVSLTLLLIPFLVWCLYVRAFFSRFFCFSYLSFVHCLAATLTFCIL